MTTLFAVNSKNLLTAVLIVTYRDEKKRVIVW